MKLGQKLLIVAVVAAVAAIAVLWMTDERNTEPASKRLGIGTFSQAIDYGPFYVARHFGWFEDAVREFGVNEILYLDLGSFDEIQGSLNAGSLHAFFSAEAPVIKLVSDKQPIQIAEIGCTLQQDVLVRKSLDISSISELRGMTIAVAEGTSSHYGLLNILESAGLSQSDIKLRPGFPGVAKPLFESGGVDAWAVWPPFVEEQIIAGRGEVLAGGNARIQSVMSLYAPMFNEQPDMAEALIDTVRRAKGWMRANPDEAITIIAQTLQLDRDVVELAWPKHNWSALLTEEVLSDIDAKAEFLKNVGVIAERADVPGREDITNLKFARVQ